MMGKGFGVALAAVITARAAFAVPSTNVGHRHKFRLVSTRTSKQSKSA